MALTTDRRPAASDAGPPPQDRHPASTGEVAAGQLLLSDMRVAGMLLNAARHRALESFGVTQKDANLATFVMTAVALDSASRGLRRMLRGPGGPTQGETLFGGAIADELLHDLAGPASRQIPNAGALMMLALMTSRSGPALMQSLHGARAVSHRAFTAFHHRYGYLIPARRRSSRRNPPSHD